MTQWIQYKLGKQYLLKNPGPTPIRGDPATLVASVGSIVLEYKVAINFDIRSGAKKSDNAFNLCP